MSGRATLATARLRLATAATRISAARTRPARLGLLDSIGRAPTYPSLTRGHVRGRPRLKGLADEPGSQAARGSRAARRSLPGVWRLRLALPWPGVPHGNAWAVAADGGIVLFDTGIGGKGRLRQFDLALAQVGFGLEDVRLLVCTHSHTDHYGLAAPIVEARRLRALDAPGLGARAPARRRSCRRAREPNRGGAPERRARRRRWSATARRARTTTTTGSTRSSSPTATCCRGSRSRPISAPGRCTRRPATPPRTSSCTSPSAS